MPSLTLDRFDGGLLLARPSSVAPANSLSVLRNMDVQPGGWLRSRAKVIPVNATLSVDSRWRGLEASGGHLWVFGCYSANNPNKNSDSVSVAADGKVTFLFYAYRQAGAVSGNFLTDPAAGGTLLGVTPWLNGMIAVQSSGGAKVATMYAQPSLSTTPTPAPAGTAITDANCPMSGIMVTAKSRVWAVSDDGQTVRFCKLADPTDWTTAANAGFLPISQHFHGSARAYGLGIYQDKLAVFGEASIQLWNISADPTAMSLDRVIAGVGTRHHRSIQTLNGDTLFLSESGVRSLTTPIQSIFPTDVDMGLPVRSMVPSPPNTSRNLNAIPSPAVDSLAASPFAQYWIAATDYWSN